MGGLTCVFNPEGYRSRIRNYRVFRGRLDLPLLTVELAWDAPFAFGDGDAEILIQRLGGAKLLQKERLLNVRSRTCRRNARRSSGWTPTSCSLSRDGRR